MKKRIGVILLSAVLAAASVTVYADNTNEKLQQAKEAQSQSESQLRNTQERIAALEAKKGESEAYLSELNTQLSELQTQIMHLQQQYADKQKELDQINEELMEARRREAQQLHDMSLRIQVLYEQSESSGMLEALCSAEDFNDFINRASNFSELNAYDRKMLKEYAQTCAMIAEKEKQVANEKRQIETLSKEGEEKRSQLQEVVSHTSAEVQAMSASIVDQKSTQAQLLASIEQQKAQIQSLTETAADEVKAADERAAAGQFSKPAQVKANPQPVQQVREEAQPSAAPAVPSRETTTETPKKQDPPAASWNGAVLTKRAGTITGPSGKETYYNLKMTGVVRIMRNMGNNDPYWVREDGVKMLGDYVMVAANLNVRPRGSILPCSLGMAIVCDTGTFAASNPYQLDIAVNW